jgi:hypothetical protein
MLSCRDVGQKASDYLDGRLSWWTRIKVRLHILMCRHCRRYLVQLRLVIRALRLAGKREQAARESEEATVRLLLRSREQQ